MTLFIDSTEGRGKGLAGLFISILFPSLFCSSSSPPPLAPLLPEPSKEVWIGKGSGGCLLVCHLGEGDHLGS